MTTAVVRSAIWLPAALFLLCGLPGCTQAPAPQPPAVAEASPQAPPQAAPAQLAVVDGDGNLGEADYGQKRTTTYTVKNNTPQPLKLEVAEKSCACAGSQITPAVLQPGESGQVVLAWMPKLDQQESGEELQTVRLWTEVAADNGQKLRLEAVGKLKPALHVNLPRGKLDFGRIDLADLSAGRKNLALEVFTREGKHQGFKLDGATSNAGLVLDPPPTPLSEDRLSALKATAGYRVNIRCAPGLPAGHFRERLRLKTDAYDRDLEVTLEGVIETGAVSVEPEAFDLSAAQLSLEKGYRAPPLKVLLRYEPGRTLRIKEVQPAFLEARAVQVKENLWRIELHLPPGRAQALQRVAPAQLEEYLTYGFDDGHVLCETDHAAAPTISIPIRGGKLQK